MVMLTLLPIRILEDEEQEIFFASTNYMIDKIKNFEITNAEEYEQSMNQFLKSLLDEE